MRVLLVAPEFPVTYWGFQHAVRLAGCRASLPPLGLISVAALLPREWDLRLVDLNVQRLRPRHLRWAEVVLVGGMRIQTSSMRDVLRQARESGCRTAVGGPAPTTAPDDFPEADILFLGEAEGRIDQLVEALAEAGPGSGQRVLAAPDDARPDMTTVPVPRFDLLDVSAYTSLSVQTSRGCPFLCEFCDIIEIFGRVPRIKHAAQVIAELDALHDAGWRGSVFVVDDNFIGNRPAVRRMLPEVAAWQVRRGYPFDLYTEASVDLAPDHGLVAGMVEAGFTSVFLGIETPDAAALEATHKKQNLRIDLHEAIDSITAAGLEVMGGFIVGFDEDRPESFELQRRFIEDSPIPLAMVGLMMALPHTALWRRLEREGRLRAQATGDQFGRPNFEPVMDEESLLAGYGQLMAQLYSAAAWYARCEAFLERAAPLPGRRRFQLQYMLTFARTILRVGVLSRRRRLFWRLAIKAALRWRHAFAWTIAHVIQGEHMVRYTEEDLLPRIERALEAVRAERAAAATP